MGRMFYGGYIYTLPEKVFFDAEKDFATLEASRKMEDAWNAYKEARDERNAAWGRAMLKLAGDLDQYEKRKM